MITDDEAIYRQITNDSKEAFRLLYEKYWKLLYRYAFRILRDRILCEDIVQEVFCDIWQRRGSRKIEFMDRYLYRSVKFQVLKSLRDGKATEEHYKKFSEMQEIISNPEATGSTATGNAALTKAIRQLPPGCQEVFSLRWNDNLSQMEIAEKLGVSRFTVKNQLAKAMQRLTSLVRVKPGE